jgi:hypothetical protein
MFLTLAFHSKNFSGFAMSVRENFWESQLITLSFDPSNFQCKGCGEWGVLVSIIFLGMKKGSPCEAKCFVLADLFPADSLFPGEEEDGTVWKSSERNIACFTNS